MEQDKMRDEFESAYMAAFAGEDSEYLRKNWLSRRPNGDYRSYQADGAWWGWQASREAVVVELPTSEFFDDGENEYGYKVSAEAYRADATLDAIHAAGIRTR